MLNDFRQRFWQPPRAHGDVVEDRTVSFLELFYDLVYVVVIAAAASTLAHDITWRSVAEFGVVFGLIWLAWLNGTIHHDLHGREDIRTRAFTFAQMLLMVLLAVYVGDAAGDGGRGFAFVYSAFVLLLAWLWQAVRRADDERFREVTRRYQMLMAVILIVVLGSAFGPNEGRIVAWGALLVIVLLSLNVLGRSTVMVENQGLVVSDSLAERFGLFTIIVLGEVIVGVAEGLSNASRDAETVVTGLVALIVGFGMWWNYFDLTGGRLPGRAWGGSPGWMSAQLPWTMSIAAGGAAMVSIVEHATDARAPVATTWLLAGSVAVGFVSLATIIRTLGDYERLAVVYHPTSLVMLGAAAAALLVAAWRPSPLILVVAMTVIQSLVWVFALSRWLSTEEAAQQVG